MLCWSQSITLFKGFTHKHLLIVATTFFTLISQEPCNGTRVWKTDTQSNSSPAGLTPRFSKYRANGASHTFRTTQMYSQISFSLTPPGKRCFNFSSLKKEKTKGHINPSESSGLKTLTIITTPSVTKQVFSFPQLGVPGPFLLPSEPRPGRAHRKCVSLWGLKWVRCSILFLCPRCRARLGLVVKPRDGMMFSLTR